MNAIYKWLLIVHVSHFTLERNAQFWSVLNRFVLFFLHRFALQDSCNFTLISWLHRIKKDVQAIKCVCFCMVLCSAVSYRPFDNSVVVCRGDWFCCSGFFLVFFSLPRVCVCARIWFSISIGDSFIPLSFVCYFLLPFLCIASMTTIQNTTIKCNIANNKTKKNLSGNSGNPQFYVQYKHNFYFMLGI